MKKQLSQNLSEKDKIDAIKSLRLLVSGIPIEDDNGKILGYIEKPDIRAIQYVLDQFKTDIKNEKSTKLKWDGLR